MPEDQSPANPHQSGDEIADYYDGVKKLEMEGHQTGIKKARNALFITAAVLLLGEIITASMTNAEWTPLMIGVIVVEVGTFIALAFWTKSKPYTAIIVGIILFILLWVLAIATVGGRAAYSGIIVRIIILSVLISALKPAKAWEDLKKRS
jgi:hypothetical protein